MGTDLSEGLEPFRSGLAAYAGRLLALDDEGSASGLVSRLISESQSWRPDGLARLISACETLDRGGRLRRGTPFDESAIAAERSPKGDLRAASETLRIAILATWASHPATERALGFDHRCLGQGDRTSERGEQAEALRLERDYSERADAVIVGGGAAGSLVASRLAAAGLQVTILEAGSAADIGTTSGSPSSRTFRNTDSLRFTAGTPVRILAGRGPGGSTNGWFGTLERPPREILQQWAKVWGDVDEAWCDRRLTSLEKILKAGSIPDHLFGENANATGSGAVSRGLDVYPLRRAAPGCQGCGTCIAGCPTGSLANVADLLLPSATKAGAVLIVDASVRTITVENGAATGVIAKSVSGASIRIQAPIVVLAAGVASTPSLLQRNALGSRSGTLGSGVSLQPMMWVAGAFEGSLRAWRGVPQSLAFGGPKGVRLRSLALPPDLASSLLPGSGVGARRAIQGVEQLAGIGVQVDEADASIEGDLMSWSPTSSTLDRLAQGISAASSILFEAGAQHVVSGLVAMPPSRSIDQVRSSLEDLDSDTPMRLLGYELSGGVSVDPDPAMGVVSPEGDVHGVRGLTVSDASSLPSAPGVAPMMGVLLHASRIADRLASTPGRSE